MARRFESKDVVISAWIVVSCLAVGCDRGSAGSRSGPSSAVEDASPGPAETPSDRLVGGRPRIVALGDSLTAGLGLDPTQAYPALLQRRLDEAGLEYEVVNAGVSGDTSAGGLRRLDWAFDGDVRVLLVALGGNDALRGLPADELARNLSEIIERAQAKKITVILAGMEAPTNFGRSYIVSFHRVYPELARKYQVALVPFLLQGVAGIEALNQHDGIHPTLEGARIVADNVWAALEPVLRSQSTAR